MADERPTYHTTDPESQKARSEYEAMIAEVERRMDPNSNTVLVVDDEVGIRKYVARGIRKSTRNIVMFEAENGQDALQVLAEIRAKYTKDPVFIVTDLNMPVMDGWAFIEHLRKEYTAQGKQHGIPIIVLSSTSGEKGMMLFKKSVHGEKAKYTPLVAIAKEVCTDPTKYSAQGEKGLVAWIRQFGRYTQ